MRTIKSDWLIGPAGAAPSLQPRSYAAAVRGPEPCTAPPHGRARHARAPAPRASLLKPAVVTVLLAYTCRIVFLPKKKAPLTLFVRNPPIR